MPSYRQHSAFFESGPVPRPAPVLTVHTVIRFASAPPTITAHEEVRCKTSTQHLRTPTPEPKVRFGSASSFSRSTSPSVHNGWGSSRQSSESSSDHESDLTSIPSDNEAEKSSIPKPSGEPGRPKSGGYNLKRASRLKAFDTIKVGRCVSRSIPANSLLVQQYVADLVENSSEIDTTKSFRSQKPNAFESIYETVCTLLQAPASLQIFLHRSKLNIRSSGNLSSAGPLKIC